MSHYTEIPEHTPVRVYWNLHKKVFSVQTRQPKGWRVHSHHDELLLNDPHFKVSRAGNQRVRDTGVKNVHAYVTGEWTWGNEAKPYSEWYDVEYNPYKYRKFMCGGIPVYEARTAHLKLGRMRITI